MPKVLIIDDQLKIAKNVQKDLSEYNPDLFRDENVFCLEKENGTFLAMPITEAKDLDHFSGSIRRVAYEAMRTILSFLKENQKECTLILIDGSLRADEWYDGIPRNLSAYLYAMLLMYLNGKTNFECKEYPQADIQNLSFMLYMDTHDTFTKVVVPLSLIYDELSEEDRKFFPKQACLYENISICRGGTSGFTNGEKNREYTNIRLPEGYKQLIKEMR